MLKGSPKLRNFVLLLGSLIFYAWGEKVFILLFIGQCVSTWGFGFAIDKYKGKPAGKIFFYLSVAVSLSGLLIFKYAGFFINNINNLFNADIKLLSLVLPIGVSFYTFQILSYTIDLYRGSISLQRSLIDFSAYVAMFPQLIAGPIVRYSDVAKELSARKHSFESFATGARRFTIGLGKKVLIANVLGELVSQYKNAGDNSVLFAWLYMTAFALHIYFDFSGYSDMAIGMGHMLGFKFPENFNYPYTAAGITDFWRRWHISLSGWFRDYVYIPMGGSRTAVRRHVFNILAVWLLTGFWHGAGWNFILWGLYFGVLLLAEKYLKFPKAVKGLYTLPVLGIGWIIFDGTDFNGIISTLGRLVGINGDGLASTASMYYLRSYMVPLFIGVIGSTELPRKLIHKLPGHIINMLEPLTVGALLIVITAFLADGSYNPFIYFRF